MTAGTTLAENGAVIVQWMRRVASDHGFEELTLLSGPEGYRVVAHRNGERFTYALPPEVHVTGASMALVSPLMDFAKRQDRDAMRILEQAHGL